MIFLYAKLDVYGKAIDREYIIHVLEVGEEESRSSCCFYDYVLALEIVIKFSLRSF
jgi:hypothetical protein